VSFRALTAASLLLAAGLPGAAGADDALARGIDPVGGRLGLTRDAYLTVEGARTAPARSFGLSLFADYHHGLMALQVGDRKIDDLLAHRLDLHLMGSYAPTGWLEVGVDLPLTVWQAHNFDRLADETGFAMEEPAAAGLGDLRFVAKARLLAEATHGVGLAALAELRLPTGDDESFLGERGAAIAPALVVERGFGDLRLALGGGYRYRSDAGRFVNLHVGDDLAFSAAGAWDLPDDFLGGGWTALAELLASTPARAPFNGPDADALKTGLQALLGLRGDLGGGFHGLVGVGRGITDESGYGRAGVRAFAGVRYQRDFHDRDGDGIEDHEDRCPDVPEDRDGFEDADGCPDPDNDRDGLADEVDQCPDEPGPKEYDGCPDTDGDEIPDQQDECPEEYGPASADGCPAGDPLARYGDGRIEIRGAVNFDTGKATLKRESFPVLDEVAALLRSHREVKRLRIEGHTDSVGSDRLNLDLSRRRAAAVVQYLIGKGIERTRLESAGYGEERPIADNATALGRAKNRRVEFTILEIDGATARE